MSFSDKDIDRLVRAKPTARRSDTVKMNTMDKMLLTLLITVLAFVITVLVYNYQGKFVQETLIQLFLGGIITEIATMGGIKIFKVRGETKKDKETDA